MRRWLLLRGWTREAAHWGSFPGMLRSAMPGDSVDCLDLPGAGRRHRERCPASIAAIVQALRADAARERLSGPFHLFGLSMGGMAAIEWARRHGDEVAAIVLVNTSAWPFCALHRRLRLGVAPQLGRIAITRDPRAKERRIYRLTTATAAPREPLIEEWARIREQRPVSGANALRQLVAAARYRAPAQAPCGRVLVLSSAGDRLVDPACSANLAAAWNARRVTHPSAGHDLPLQEGAWVAAETARWASA